MPASAPIAPIAPAPTAGAARSRGGLWIALGLAVLTTGACAVGLTIASGAYVFARHDEGPPPAPLPSAPVSPPGPVTAPSTPPSTFAPDTATPEERALACGRALRCCESLMTQMSGSPTGCDLFRDPPPYVRTARCVELTSNYRSMIETRGGDTSACD